MLTSGSISLNNNQCVNLDELFGVGGQVQVIRSHPGWKSPMTALVGLRGASMAENMALYMAESEQRLAALLTCVKIADNRCEYALGVMVERLPDVAQFGGGEEQADHVDISIRNLAAVQKRGLDSYWVDSTEAGTMQHTERVLGAILDDCLAGQCSTAGVARWSQSPRFKCTCGAEKVWRSLSLLPRSEVQFIIADQKNVEVRCLLIELLLPC